MVWYKGEANNRGRCYLVDEKYRDEIPKNFENGGVTDEED